MTDLLLSVACSAIIFVVFRLFAQFRINNLQAIVANYFTASALGFLFTDIPLTFRQIAEAPWLIWVLVTGLLFIVLFNIMALSAQRVGVGITSVANKMSFVIPVIAAWWLFNDQLTALRVAAIAVALTGVFLASTNNGQLTFHRRYLYLPVVLFVGGGILDTLLQYTMRQYHLMPITSLYTSLLFSVAGALGFVVMLVAVMGKRSTLSPRSWVAGILLGIPNFGSIYFLLRAIGTPELPAGSVYPLNNVGIVLASVLLGMLLFRERITLRNWIGVFICLCAIAIIGFESDIRQWLS
jgi:drug/metabolite transporter (DMT)-like permease